MNTGTGWQGPQSTSAAMQVAAIKAADPLSDLDFFLIQLKGEKLFVIRHLGVYPRVILTTPDRADVSFESLNYGIHLLRLSVVGLVAYFEDFLETTARRVLVGNRSFLHKFDSRDAPLRLSITDIEACQSMDEVWQRLIERVLQSGGTGRLSKYASLMKSIDAPLPDRKQTDGIALAELFSRRNVIVHNRSRPDLEYLATVPQPATYPSGGLVIDIGYFRSAVDLLRRTSRALVKQLVEIHHLEETASVTADPDF